MSLPVRSAARGRTRGAELARRRRHWRGIDNVEFGTLDWVDFGSTTAASSSRSVTLPAEFEAAYWRKGDPIANVGLNELSLR
jgi:hypothetical protein